MNSVFSIALISLRNAVRSKIVVVLLCFLFLTLLGLPLTIKGDGTLEGHVRLLLRYTLGSASLILSLSILWASCAAVSSEIKDRQIQMVLCKPVRPIQIWFGKWLGLSILHVALLTLCAVITYGALRWTTQPGTWSSEERDTLYSEVLIAQRKVLPQPADVRDEVLRQYQLARTSEEWPEALTTADALRIIERSVRTQDNSISAGNVKRWVFRLPYAPPADRPLILRYRFSLSVMDIEPVKTQWQIGQPQAANRLLVEVEDPPHMWHSLLIPPEAVASDRTLTLEFANVHDRPITVLFNPDTGLQLMVYEGGFTANYVRAILLLAFYLALLGAIGLTAGTYFSTPVAALASFYALLLLHSGRFVQQLATRELRYSSDPVPGLWETWLAGLTRVVHGGLNVIIQPVYTRNPLDIVSVGELIAWSDVGMQFFTKIVLYAGVLALLSAFHLARKEVALPR